MDAEREMTLDEFVDTLGPVHRARRELTALRARVQELEAEARKVPILGAAVESLHKERDEMGRIAGKALRELIDICGRSGGGAALAEKGEG